jgi:hypothetical protein
MGRRAHSPAPKTPWESIRIWRRIGDTIVPVVGRLRLAELYFWRAGKTPPEQWCVDAVHPRTLRSPLSVDWADFPEVEAGALALETEAHRPLERRHEPAPLRPFRGRPTTAGTDGTDTTRRIYDRQWRGFATWCVGQGVSPLPASDATVATYLAALAEDGLAPASIDVALCAISKTHESAGYPSPRASDTVREARSGIRRA